MVAKATLAIESHCEGITSMCCTPRLAQCCMSHMLQYKGDRKYQMELDHGHTGGRKGRYSLKSPTVASAGPGFGTPGSLGTAALSQGGFGAAAWDGPSWARPCGGVGRLPRTSEGSCDPPRPQQPAAHGAGATARKGGRECSCLGCMRDMPPRIPAATGRDFNAIKEKELDVLQLQTVLLLQ